MRIGFIGLGHLGSAILSNLLSRGYSPLIWNRSPGKTREFETPVAGSPQEVMDGSDVVLINIYDSSAVRELLDRDDGLLAGDVKGKVIVDMTTNDHSSVHEFARRLDEQGGHYLECPVIGTVPPALRGELTMLVSGDESSFNQVRPILDVIANPVIRLQERGMATRMKLINNLLMARMMGGIAESIAMAKRSGIGSGKAIEVLENGAGNCMLLKGKKQKLIDGDFSTHFSVKNLTKDLGYAKRLAEDVGLSPFTDVMDLFRRSEHQDEDFSAILKDLDG